jgi:ATP-binding cassette, subfamily B, bacterial
MRFPVKKLFFLLQTVFIFVTLDIGLCLCGICCNLDVSVARSAYYERCSERRLVLSAKLLYRIGGLMIVIVAIQNIGNFFVDYKGPSRSRRIRQISRPLYWSIFHFVLD